MKLVLGWKVKLRGRDCQCAHNRRPRMGLFLRERQTPHRARIFRWRLLPAACWFLFRMPSSAS